MFWKPKESIPRPFVNHLRKIKEIMKETWRYPNSKTSHLGTKATYFKFLEIFHIIFKALERNAMAICKIFEKNKGNCEIKLKVPKRWKLYEALLGPSINNLRKLKENMTKTWRYPNFGNSHLNTKVPHVKYLEIFQK